MSELTESERAALLDAAAAAIRARLIGADAPDVAHDASPRLLEPGASFVTLERGDRLLGCIGTIEADRPLAVDVAHNAVQSAFADPRLPAVTEDDFRSMSIKVSVLSPLEEMPADSRDRVREWLRPWRDGLLLSARGARGTFLPSVWEKLSDPDAFLDHLLAKAGLPPHGWPSGATIWRYTTDEFGSPGPRDL